MIVQISDDESLVLQNLIFNNCHKGKCDTRDLFIKLENGHLFIVLNAGGALKIKSFRDEAGKLLRESREISIKRKPTEYEGICIDLNKKGGKNEQGR